MSRPRAPERPDDDARAESPWAKARALASTLATTEAVGERRDEHRLVRRFGLVVTSGPDAGKAFNSTGERAVVGTHESADLVLTDATVSRFHCEIAPAGSRVLLTDLGSRNGTTIDGVEVREAYLKSGSIVGVGRTELRLELADDHVRVPVSSRERFGLAVGASLAMRRVFALLERAAATDATVLLEGETGTGKELAAESVHRESARRDGPFVVVDCASLPRELLESELFGHERGAFTGAVASRQGAFEAANGGTVFLDEIGELAPELQPKLLRVLERREVKPVGSNKWQPVDVRVVAATNRNLRAEVNAGRFRSDLYYRLAVVEVALPALRERMEDLPDLVRDLVRQLGAKNAALVEREEFLAEVRRHRWPGNVRELRNYVERCLALDHPTPITPSGALEPDDPGLGIDASEPIKVVRDRWVAIVERRYLTALLAKHQGNVTEAARTAGVDRVHLYRLLWRHGLR